MVNRVVLDVELVEPHLTRKPSRANERRETRMKAGPRLLDGKQLAIAPQGLRPRFDQAAADGAADGRVVVRHFERTETLPADPQRLGRICRTA